MGLLTGQELAKQGANVVLCDINRDAVEACAEEIRKNGGKAIGAVVDVRNYDDICAARDRALQEFGTIDILHNCAGGASCRIRCSFSHGISSLVSHIVCSEDLHG